MLKATRLFMLLLISMVYYVHIPAEQTGWKWFSLAATVIFTVNHFLMLSKAGSPARIFGLLCMDGLLTAAYGFVLIPSTLYLILFGVLALTLFLCTNQKHILYMFALLFFVSWVIVLVYTYIQLGTIDAAGNIVSFMFVFFQALVGRLIRELTLARQTVHTQYEKLTESHASLQEAHKQLHRYAGEVEELTVIRERNHIAREIHDTVGHNMTALLVQLQVAEELLKRDVKQAAQTIQLCSELARNSLQEVRVSVRTLQEEEELSLVAVIRKLLTDFSKTVGIDAEFHLQGDPMRVPVSLHPTITRLIQESLTNAKKHGNASRCSISLLCREELVAITVTDNGSGAKVVQPGFGLRNMKERTEEHGGQITFRSEAGGGFQMRAEFPLVSKKWTVRGMAQ